MTTKESGVREHLKDITKCCVCKETYKDPVVLPCTHTFCLKCLEEAGAKTSNSPGDQLSCLVCRKDFTIPEEGYAALQKNFFMEKLVEIATIASSSEGPGRCEDCMEEKSESMSVSEVPLANMYCTDCQRKLCLECSRYHLKSKLSKNHQLLAFEDFQSKVQIVAPSNCIKHDIEFKLYCCECKEPLCLSCVDESHQTHRLQGVRSTVEGFKNEIKDILTGVELCMSEVAARKEVLNCEVEGYCKHLESLKLEVRAHLRATIMLVSEHANVVIQDIEQLKALKRKEALAEVENRDGDLTCLESFKVFCSKVMTKGSASDICCTIDELRERFEDLKKIHELNIEIKTDLHRMSFQTSDLEEFAKTENYNIIGTIQECHLTEVEGQCDTKIANDKISNDGDIKIEVICGMAISCKNGILAKINCVKQELDETRRRMDGLEMDNKAQIEKRIDEFRVELGKVRPLKSISRLQMTQPVQPSCKEVPSPGISIDYKRSPNLVKTIQGVNRSREDWSIFSLTVLDDELFLGCFNRCHDNSSTDNSSNDKWSPDNSSTTTGLRQLVYDNWSTTTGLRQLVYTQLAHDKTFIGNSLVNGCCRSKRSWID